MVPYAIHKGRNTLLRAGREDLLAQMDEYVLPPDNFAQPLTDAWFRHLPLRDWIDRLKETAPYFHEYFDEEKEGPYWSRINLMRNAHKISLPMFHVSSWYDIFLEGALNGYQALRDRAATAEARRSQRLLVGPWAHIRPYTAPTSRDTGDIDFGPEARIELHEHLLRWFDYWLKDIETGLMDEPPVSIFVMGENRWRPSRTGRWRGPTTPSGTCTPTARPTPLTGRARCPRHRPRKSRTTSTPTTPPTRCRRGAGLR